MINRIDKNSNISSINRATKSGISATADSFFAVYNSMQNLRTETANRSASPMTTQTMKTTPFYASMYAPGSSGGYAPRPVDLDDPKATRQKLEELKADIMDKGASGFFDKMDDNESFAYLFERYSDTFGANFWTGNGRAMLIMAHPRNRILRKAR